MVSSWFRSSSSPETSTSLTTVIGALYPKKSGETAARFSQLLLEHGEKHLQDWAVLAFSSVVDEADDLTPDSPRRSDKIQWAQSPSVVKTKPARRHKDRVHPLIDKETVPSGHLRRIEGRLHLCSRSLVFEPNDPQRGIIRCTFARMTAAPVDSIADESYESMCVEFTCSRHAVMKAHNNLIGPFELIPLRVAFRFTFLHSPPQPFLELCGRLFEMTAQGKNRPSHSTPELDALLRPMLERPFAMDNLVDIRELILVSNIRSALLTPLQEKPGVFCVTADRLYFQPAAGVLAAGEPPAMRWLLRNVLATARRYRGLRDAGLEIYWKDGTSTLFSFDRRHDRELVLRYLPAVLCFTDRSFVVEAHKEWKAGVLSNYDYLLALNSAAGRSFHDLSRYPVFPWVIADFESSKLDLTKEKSFRDLTKPVGALNPERLEYFTSRMKSMQDMGEPFLYGTHYSAPGYVLYFLVRSMPEHMLCLQNGKFDAPDRMFHSIEQCYRCALTNHADVKELIPEFYNAGHDFDFLINAKGLQLGATQNGERVDDVQLPPWAKSSRDFIKKNRKALESEICTRMLPRWIDLVFGCRSRGEAAMEADNLFHPITYMGPTDLASMQSEEERFQAELQATEFGIVPDQLFHGPHPQRHESAKDDDFISLDIGRASSKDDSTGGRETWELLEPPLRQQDLTMEQPEVDKSLVGESMSREEAWSSDLGSISTMDNPAVPASPTRPNLALRGKGEALKSSGGGDLPSMGASPSREPNSLSQLASPMIQSFAEAAKASDWDLKFLERSEIHGDAVSGCALLLHETDMQQSILATTSLDGGLKVHKMSLGEGNAHEEERKGFPSTLSRFSYSTILSRGQVGSSSAPSKLTEYRSHTSRDPLASLVLASDSAEGHVAFAGGHDDVVLAYGINSACAVASVYSHRDAVTGLDLIQRTPFDAESALWLENSTHIMISGSWDATVKVWSASVSSGEAVAINREPLAELFDADSSIVCVSAKSMPTGGIVIGAGCADGSFCVWNVHSDGVQVVIHNEPARRGSGPCSVVKWVSEAGRLVLFAAFSTGMVASYALVDGNLQRVNAVSVGVAVLSLAYADGFLLIGCADGGLRLIPVRDGSHFEKPTLWNAVNNKASPGISSIAVTVKPGEGGKSFLCSTGGDDGSIALFELKRIASAEARQH